MKNLEPLQVTLHKGWKHVRLITSYIGWCLVKQFEEQSLCYIQGANMIITAAELPPFLWIDMTSKAGNTTQNKAVITNNSTTIGLFTTDTSDKNLQPKWAGLPVVIYSICTPDDGRDCRPKHVE